MSTATSAYLAIGVDVGKDKGPCGDPSSISDLDWPKQACSWTDPHTVSQRGLAAVSAVAQGNALRQNEIAASDDLMPDDDTHGME